jgi:hypothetical protein
MTTPPLLTVALGPAFTVQLPDGEWFQPAGKHGRGGVLPRLARKLIAEGMDPATPIRAMRGTTQIWRFDHPLSYWAALSASEPDGSSVKMVRYVAMPSYWDKEVAEEGDDADGADLDDTETFEAMDTDVLTTRVVDGTPTPPQT